MAMDYLSDVPYLGRETDTASGQSGARPTLAASASTMRPATASPRRWLLATSGAACASPREPPSAANSNATVRLHVADQFVFAITLHRDQPAPSTPTSISSPTASAATPSAAAGQLQGKFEFESRGANSQKARGGLIWPTFNAHHPIPVVRSLNRALQP